MTRLAQSSFLLLTVVWSVEANPHFEAARPVLEQNCLECHHADEGKGGLKLHTQEDFLLGGDEELAYNQKAPKDSELLRRIRLPHDHDEFMPPSSEKVSREALTSNEITTLEKWLIAGAPWPQGIILEPKEKTAPLEDPNKLEPQLAKIEIFPSKVSLETASDFHRLVVLATSQDATTRDVSASAKITIANPKLAKLEGTTLLPLADGETIVQVDFRGQSSKNLSLKIIPTQKRFRLKLRNFRSSRKNPHTLSNKSRKPTRKAKDSSRKLRDFPLNLKKPTLKKTNFLEH